MKFSATDIAPLLLKKITGDLTETESVQLEAWRYSSEANQREYDSLLQLAVLKSELKNYRAAQTVGERVTLPILPTTDYTITQDVVASASSRIHFLRRHWWAAASVILLMGIGAYLWITHSNNKETPIIAQTTEAIPGSDGAILTLADGRQVVLDSLGNGVIASQNGSDVVLNNGTLAYAQTGTATEAVVHNTITTPNGRQFSATLPDGTRVWLNAGSSIRYPTVFQDKQRSVEVTGEVYLEVAANKSKPFFVSANDMEVQVLGTSFNINAYSDEPHFKTTLFDGSIKVLKKLQPHSSVVLHPGQQVLFDENMTINKAVDIEQVIAWKNGVFNLNGATLEAFMRQIARWYDLQVVYQGSIPHEIFKGKIGRDLQLSQILKVLTLYNIKYQLSGKTITIEPQ